MSWGACCGCGVLAALFGGVVYMFSGFLIVSVVFTMFLAAVPWLPLLLAVIEYIIRKQEEKGVRSFQPDPLCGGWRGRSSGWWCWPVTRS